MPNVHSGVFAPQCENRTDNLMNNEVEELCDTDSKAIDYGKDEPKEGGDD